MHIGGYGDPEQLAAGVKAVWDAVKEVHRKNPQPASRFQGKTPLPGEVTADPIEKVLGQKNQTQDGVVKVTVARE